MMDSENNKFPKETTAYQCYRHYMDYFLIPSGLIDVMKECRDYYRGKQYSETFDVNMPKPVVNICFEYVEKVGNKLMEAPAEIQFISDQDDETLDKLDEYYSYLMKKIRNDYYMSRVVKRSLIDGTGVLLTSFDENSLGDETLYKGFFRRKVLMFEDTFYDDGYIENEQDQRYCGYVFYMNVGAVKKMLEGSDAEIEKKKKLVVPDNYFENGSSLDDGNADPHNQDTQNCLVIVRFFRVDGEVFFEASTKYCDIFSAPHSLNPKMNSYLGKKLQKEYAKRIEKLQNGTDESDDPKEVPDYDIDFSTDASFSKLVKSAHKDHVKRKAKFSRYPLHLLKLYPRENRIFGDPGLAYVIPNQRIINMATLCATLIMQYHAMPKWLVKPNAMKGQIITNRANEVLVDNTPITEGRDWGITRLGSGDAVNSNLLDMSERIQTQTRNSIGFADIQSDSTTTGSTSGYALEQKIHQQNIVLENIQKNTWDFRVEVAKTDLLYLKHYVDKAKFYSVRSDAEMGLQENYRLMSQDIVNADAQSNGTDPILLPKPRRRVVEDISSEMFDADFDVTIDIEQGIAASEISEAQHFENVYQYVLAGNADADKVKALIINDPSFSRKTRQRMSASLDALEVSQLQVKNQEIANLKGMVQQLLDNLNKAKQGIAIIQQKANAQQKAFDQATKEQQAIVTSLANSEIASSGVPESESKVKSDNAKGKTGGHFAK